MVQGGITEGTRSMARKSQRPPTNCTILIVDDQEEVLISMQQLLEREGHHVLGAQSGEQALALFRSRPVTLMIVDYFMPRMTGEQLIRQIRRLDPFVQIILQTGYAGEKPARVMMAELDIQGYHDKTEGPDKLLLWVDSAIKAHRLMTQLRERERLQGELVANLSHEFRTPLHIIGGYADLLRDGDYGSCRRKRPGRCKV
jgi:DNA-binding NtrC family response regulator